MFDVSFSELMVVAVVALLVIGPEKLPKVARTVGAFAGRMQRYTAQLKEEINREVRFEELQNLQQEIKQSVEQHSSAVQASFNETFKPTNLEDSSPQVKKTVKKPVKKTIKKSPAGAKPQETLNKSDISKYADNVHDLTGENSQALAESSQKHQTLSALEHLKHLENSSTLKQKKTLQ